MALAIVAVALAACVRAAGKLATNHSMMNELAWALISEKNTIAEIRAQRIYPTVGRSSQPCPRGRMAFVCERHVEATTHNGFRNLAIRLSRTDDGRMLTELRALTSAWP